MRKESETPDVDWRLPGGDMKTITGKRMYTSNAVEVRHAHDIAIGLCTERHGYDAPGGRLTVCWPCQEAAAEIVNEMIEDSPEAHVGRH